MKLDVKVDTVLGKTDVDIVIGDIAYHVKVSAGAFGSLKDTDTYCA